MQFQSGTRPVAAVLALALLHLACNAHGQAWPTRSLKIVVPYAAGGQPDIVARALAEPLSKALGQPVMVENKVGAGGALGADYVAKSAPDGCTMLLGTNGPMAILPALSPTFAYDPIRDFAPVTVIGTSPLLIVVSSDSNVSTITELVARAKSQPGKLNYSSVGTGTVSHLSVELLNEQAGVGLQHIPYNGGPPAIAALLAGDAQVLSLNTTSLLPYMQSGRVKALAQASAKRSPQVPDIPTIAESGYPGFEIAVWMVIVVPAKTPPEVVRRLNVAFVKVIRDLEFHAHFWTRQSIDPVGSAPEEVTRLIRAESDKWSALARTAHIKLD